MEGRGASIVIPPRFGVSWEREGPPESLAFSGVRISCDPTRLHGRAEGGVVPLGLVGVGLRKVGYRAIEALALAQVGGDLHAVTGAGVRPGQRPAAQRCIEGQFIGRHALDVSRALHVLQLAPVEVASCRAAKPAEEDVARGLHQPLAGHDAVSVVLVGAGLDVALQYRGTGLLDLEEQGVILVAPFEQYYVSPGAHTSDPYDLPRRVHKAVPVEQVATIFLQGALVALQNGVDLGPDLVFLGDTHQERRIVFYHPASIDDPGQFGESVQLSRLRAFRTVLLNFFAVFFLVPASEIIPRTSSSLTREYQTSSSPISENSAIRCR